MAGQTGKGSSRERLADRYAAWAARRAPAATGFVSQPEPRSIGMFARGKQIVGGNLLLAGHLAEAPGILIWDVPSPDHAFSAEAHGFAWLDDLVALGTADARRLAQSWTQDWIRRFAQGGGPGWSPDLTGRRVIRWIHHATFLLAGQDKPAHDAYFAALSRQAAFLARRAKAARPGLPRFEAVTGLLYAGLSLIGMEQHIQPAKAALSRDCQTEIDRHGGILSRNPEELLEVVTLLSWALRALTEGGHALPEPLTEAIDRTAPCLRALRHADGGLARFHGGGAGVEGRLDQALAASAGFRPAGHMAEAMGYLRLSGGRTSVIMDAADPPGGSAMATAHASTGAFELTSGRRPLVVNCGSGMTFGRDWSLAGRATQSHSTLVINGASSSRFGAGAKDALLAERATVTDLQVFDRNGAEGSVTHDGWRASHGVLTTRELHLSPDGRRVVGTDALISDGAAAQRQFEEVLNRSGLQGLPFSIRFHLHPDVDATLDMGGTAISMQLRSGEIWVMRHDGQGMLALEPSAYLEKGRLKPRPSQQIVLSADAREFETRIGWTLAKAQDTPLAIRDLDRDEPVPI